eukprot:5783848-Pleurochrysis_carterae.AAC.2
MLGVAATCTSERARDALVDGCRRVAVQYTSEATAEAALARGRNRCKRHFSAAPGSVARHEERSEGLNTRRRGSARACVRSERAVSEGAD